MLASRTRTFLVAMVCLLVLTACTYDAAPTKSGSGDSAASKLDKSDDTNSGSGKAVALPGTGRYAIGTEAPLGGYQLKGEPNEQPSGCTWSIQGADGGKTYENTGQYAFLTDIREAVTFVTDGRPDWEKFQ